MNLKGFQRTLITSSLCLAFASFSMAEAPEALRFSQSQLQALPEWTNAYNDPLARRLILDIPTLMEKLKISRLEASTLQRDMRDVLSSAQAVDSEVAFQALVQNAQEKKLNLPLNVEKLKKASFIVAFDLDETIYDQFTATENCSTYQFVKSDGSKKFIHITPGAEATIKKINSLGGAVVLYSANKDSVTFENVSNWKIDGIPATESPLISGILANSYLNAYSKTKTQDMVLSPAKDLRLIDETLKKVIIIDDNPTRIFQPSNHRELKKFVAREYCSSKKGNAIVQKAFESLMSIFSKEVSESVSYMKARNQSRGTRVSFAEAFLPYTATGQIAAKLLKDTHQWSDAEAISYIRQHSDIVDRKF